MSRSNHKFSGSIWLWVVGSWWRGNHRRAAYVTNGSCHYLGWGMGSRARNAPQEREVPADGN